MNYDDFSLHYYSNSNMILYHIAGNFPGVQFSWKASVQSFHGFIFVDAAWLDPCTRSFHFAGVNLNGLALDHENRKKVDLMEKFPALR